MQRLIDDLLQDLRYGFRMLRRAPWFSTLAIICLTIGIGATTSVFSWIEGVLLRPFPTVANQDRMMALAGTTRGVDRGDPDVSWPDFQDFRRSCTLFEAFIADKITGTTLSVGDHAEDATGSIVSANYFDALGVRPILGRGFRPEEEVGRNAHPVAVISYQAWQSRFKGDPDIIGRTQVLSGVQHTIVGVTPEGFNGTFVGWAMQFWVPVSMQELFDSSGYKLEDRAAPFIEGFVILKPGVTPAQAQAEISSVAQRLEVEYPASNRGRGVKLFPLWKTPFNNAGALLPALGIALAVVVFVLLIACANVCNLLLVKASGRAHELTVRLAIGCGRGRLVRQLLTEGLIMTAFAAACSLIVASWCRNLLPLLLPLRFGRTLFLPGNLDWRVLILSSGFCLGATLLFGMVPAFHARKIDLTSALKAESGGVVGGRSRSFFRSGLVVVQVSLSFVLMVGAGLLIQSLQGIRKASPGFPEEGRLVTGIDMEPAGYDLPRIRNFQDELTERLQADTGVEAVAFVRRVPFSYGDYASAPIVVEGYEALPDQQLILDYTEFAPGFLAAMGIQLVSGREFTKADNETAPLVAIVNEQMAAEYWQGDNPIGRRFKAKDRWLQVVGVARGWKDNSLTEPTRPSFYVPLRQGTGGESLIIKTSLSAESMAKVLLREIRSIDPSLAPSEIITMREQIDRTSSAQQVAVMMLAVFGGLALLLAAIGLYGVMSYTVSQGTREMGLRMALGARRSHLIRLVMTRGLALTALGVVVGSVATIGLTRVIADLLYKVSPRDPASYGAALAILLLAAVAACFLPAWRATRTDPVQALRN